MTDFQAHARIQKGLSEGSNSDVVILFFSVDEGRVDQ